MPKPSFENMRAEYDGFLPEGDKPSKENVRAYLRLVVQGVTDWIDKPIEDWDEVLDLTYRSVAFFRTYYCGEDAGKMPCLSSAASYESTCWPDLRQRP